MNRRLACTTADLAPGTSMTLHWDHAIALFRNEEGEFFATSDTCTHEKWSLGDDSDLEGNEVVCPLHMARFDIRTGAALCFPATMGLKSFGVTVENDDVYILIEDDVDAAADA